MWRSRVPPIDVEWRRRVPEWLVDCIFFSFFLSRSFFFLLLLFINLGEKEKEKIKKKKGYEERALFIWRACQFLLYKILHVFLLFFFFFFISLSTFLRVYSFLARFCTVPRGFSRAHRTKSDHSGFSRARIKRFPELTHHRISLNSIFFFFFNFKKEKK